MKNCLVTKLRGIVENNNLLKLNELKINFINTTSYNNRPTSNVINMIITTSEVGVELSINNGSYFTDMQSSNLGTTLILEEGINSFFIQINKESVMSVLNKQLIIGLGQRSSAFEKKPFIEVINGSTPAYHPVLLIDQLKYLSEDLHTLDITNSILIGDISGLNSKTKLIYFSYNLDIQRLISSDSGYLNKYSELYGDATYLITKEDLQYFSAKFSKITFDIPDTEFFWNTHITKKNINIIFTPNTININIEGFPKTYSEVFYMGSEGNESPKNIDTLNRYNVYGDVGKFSTKLATITENKNTTLQVWYAKDLNNLTGNIAEITDGTYFFSNFNGNSIFTYDESTVANKRNLILSTDGVYLGEYCDDFLISMSIKTPSAYFWKNIGIRGSVTDKSKEAREILKSKGYNITITNEKL